MYAMNDVKGIVQDLLEVKYAVPRFEITISSRVYYRVMSLTNLRLTTTVYRRSLSHSGLPPRRYRRRRRFEGLRVAS